MTMWCHLVVIPQCNVSRNSVLVTSIPRTPAWNITITRFHLNMGIWRRKKHLGKGGFIEKNTLAREATTWPGVARSGSTLTITMFVSTWRGVNLDQQIVQDLNTKIAMFQSAWDLEIELFEICLHTLSSPSPISIQHHSHLPFPILTTASAIILACLRSSLSRTTWTTLKGIVHNLFIFGQI